MSNHEDDFLENKKKKDEGRPDILSYLDTLNEGKDENSLRGRGKSNFEIVDVEEVDSGSNKLNYEEDNNQLFINENKSTEVINEEEGYYEDEPKSPEEELDELSYLYYKLLVKVRNYRIVLSIFLFLLLATVLAYYIKNNTEMLDNLTGEDNWAIPFTSVMEPPLTETEKENVTKVLSLMYNIDDVNDLISKNDAILSHFTMDLHDSLDIRDSKNFDVRYFEFGNEETFLEIGSITKDEDGIIVVKYTITTDLTFPSNRISYLTFNDDNVIDYFYEQRVYPLFSE